MDHPVTFLKGLGAQKAKVLAEWGVVTIGDLLNLFPRRYIDRTQTEDVLWEDGQTISTVGMVTAKRRKYARRQMLEVNFDTGDRDLTLVFFKGIAYFDKLMQEGKQAAVSGKLKRFGRRFQIVHPEFEMLAGTTGTEGLTHVGRIVPVYPSSEAGHGAGLDTRGLRRFLKAALEHPDVHVPELELPLPSDGTIKKPFLDRRQSYSEIHFPESVEANELARARFIYEEFFYFHLMMYSKKREGQTAKRSVILNGKGEDFNVDIPFQFTGDQDRAVAKILKLAAADYPYSVLLQGDVGSGKTAVILKVAERYIQAGYQVALLAPTEVLAKQHFEKITGYIKNFLFPVELLVGKEKAKTKREKLAGLADGSLRLVVGTHALFQEGVEFKKLGLTIIDEQHRFGVKQREALRQKGDNPDLIALTATPIPRTLAMSLYSNLETVYLRQKPAGRQEIETKWFFEDKLASLYKGVKKYVNQGQQAYIVYPLIEDSEKSDLNACVSDFEELSATVFADYTTGLLHGRLTTEEKEKVMNDFRAGKVQILFSTTVIEVGVDVPNATVMMIRNAERFGLSALHQLRGRVGRSDLKSFCILVSSHRITDDGKERLQALVDSNDGFYLADVDLRLRGPGEVLGIRQSGLPEFKIADFAKDSELCRSALVAVTEMPPSEYKTHEPELVRRFANYESIYT